MWDGVSFLVGILLGLMLMLIVVWVCWSSRTFIFTVCPRSQSRICRGLDYINLPGLALESGIPLQDILFLNEGSLYYKRVPKTPNCVPLPSTQTVKVRFPQYCSFSIEDGQEFEAKQISPGSEVYSGKVGDQPIEVLSSGGCGVISSQPSGVNSGRPLLKWDPLSTNQRIEDLARQA